MKPAIQLLMIVVTGGVLVAQGGGELRLVPAEVKWPAPAGGSVGTSGNAGTQTVILKGDPTKPGLYTMLLRVGPNTKIESVWFAFNGSISVQPFNHQGFFLDPVTLVERFVPIHASPCAFDPFQIRYVSGREFV